MRFRRTRRALAALLQGGALLLAAPAGAVPISGTSGAGDPTVDPALADGAVIDFDAASAGDFDSLTLGDVTFIGTDAPFTVGNSFIGSFNTRGLQSLYNGLDGIPTAFRFDFTVPMAAFGFNFGASDMTWRLRAFDGGGGLIEFFDIDPVFSSNNGEYFGISAAGIAYATLTNQGGTDFVFIENFTTVIPEPSTAVLVGLGVLALGLRRRS